MCNRDPVQAVQSRISDVRLLTHIPHATACSRPLPQGLWAMPANWPIRKDPISTSILCVFISFASSTTTPLIEREPRVAGFQRERVCCLLVLNLVSSTLPCIRRPRPRLGSDPEDDRAFLPADSFLVCITHTDGTLITTSPEQSLTSRRPLGRPRTTQQRILTAVGRRRQCGASLDLGNGGESHSSLPLLAPQLLVEEQRFGPLGTGGNIRAVRV